MAFNPRSKRNSCQPPATDLKALRRTAVMCAMMACRRNSAAAEGRQQEQAAAAGAAAAASGRKQRIRRGVVSWTCHHVPEHSAGRRPLASAHTQNARGRPPTKARLGWVGARSSSARVAVADGLCGRAIAEHGHRRCAAAVASGGRCQWRRPTTTFTAALPPPGVLTLPSRTLLQLTKLKGLRRRKMERPPGMQAQIAATKQTGERPRVQMKAASEG